MSLAAVLQELPEDFVTERTARGVLAVQRDLAPALAAAGFGAQGGERLRPSDVSGRAPLSALELDGRPYLVRHFHHGGLLRWLTGTRYRDAARPFRELLLSSTLRRDGVRTPLVAAARARRAPLLGWSLELVTARVEDALDGAELFEELRSGALAPAVGRRAAEALGTLVGRLHRLGLLHADLQPRNVLFERAPLARVASGGGEPLDPWILDLDRSERRSHLSAPERQANLARLYRALERRDRRAAPWLSRTALARFLRSYGRALADGEGREGREGSGGSASCPSCHGWREDWRAVAARVRGRAVWHRLAGRLEGLFGGGPERRDAAVGG